MYLIFALGKFCQFGGLLNGLRHAPEGIDQPKVIGVQATPGATLGIVFNFICWDMSGIGHQVYEVSVCIVYHGLKCFLNVFTQG